MAYASHEAGQIDQPDLATMLPGLTSRCHQPGLANSMTALGFPSYRVSSRDHCADSTERLGRSFTAPSLTCCQAILSDAAAGAREQHDDLVGGGVRGFNEEGSRVGNVSANPSHHVLRCQLQHVHVRLPLQT